jgi:hypothetical protein
MVIYYCNAEHDVTVCELHGTVCPRDKAIQITTEQLGNNASRLPSSDHPSMDTSESLAGLICEPFAVRTNLLERCPRQRPGKTGGASSSGHRYKKSFFDSSCHDESEKARAQIGRRKSPPFILSYYAKVDYLHQRSECATDLQMRRVFTFFFFLTDRDLTWYSNHTRRNHFCYFISSRGTNAFTSNWSIYSFVAEHFQHAHRVGDRIARHKNTARGGCWDTSKLLNESSTDLG